LAESGILTTLDRVGNTIQDETQLKTITNTVLNLARSTDPKKTAKIAKLLNTNLKDISQ
jgi:hypothetical protein